MRQYTDTHVVCHVGPCRMTLELVSEEVSSGDLSTLFPFNALRNHALLLVRTEVRPLCCPFAKIVHAVTLHGRSLFCIHAYTISLSHWNCDISMQLPEAATAVYALLLLAQLHQDHSLSVQYTLYHSP